MHAPSLSHSANEESETLIEEDSDDIVFMFVADDPVPHVKAATLDKLVEVRLRPFFFRL